MDHTTGHLRAMKEQIDGFSVQAASCSDPKDRAFVERSMLRWFHNLARNLPLSLHLSSIGLLTPCFHLFYLCVQLCHAF